ncbi:ROK family protein [Kribbella pittospori]|uniref:ROK family protein n=1 Tax=Kribbella pittospori TaxID=722689 RepID=A0A4R0JVF8_9ACTN|nr:ROK family protein [Kribbella pittospori]
MRTGLGAGFVLEGAPFHPSRYGVTELGHLRAVEKGRTCACGATGCLETVLSEEYLREPSALGTAVTFANGLVDDPGSTQPATRDMSVSVLSFTGSSSLTRFVAFTDDGGLLENCSVDGDFTGTVSADAVRCAGSGHAIRGTYSDGDLRLGTGTDMDIDDDVPDGVVGCTGTGNNTVIINGGPVQSC